jgi:hypothetical protein
MSIHTTSKIMPLRRKILWLSIIAAVMIGIAFYNSSVSPANDLTGTIIVNIPKGAGFFRITEILDNAGLVHNRPFFWVLAIAKGAPGHIRASRYELSGSMSPAAILDKLVRGEIKVYQVPEDITVNEVAKRLSAVKLVNEKEFMALATDRSFLASLNIEAESIEGYLYPDTYRFDLSMTTKEVIRILVGQFWREVTPEMRKRAQEIGLTLPQWVTLASIIDSEGIKDKAEIPVKMKDLLEEKKASFTERLSKNGPDLKFEMHGKFINGFLNQGHIDVFNMSNAKRIQKIIINDNYEIGHFDWDVERFEYNGREVQMVDMNFDGYLDLRILDNAGATGNNWYSSYIYDKPSRKFKLHYELSELSGVKVDASSKQIITYDRGGYCTECIQYFKVIADKLFLVKIEWTEIDRRRDKEVGGVGCFKYIGKPRYKNLKIDGSTFMYDDEYRSSIRRNMQEIKEEPLYGSLDRRERGLLGNPMD